MASSADAQPRPARAHSPFMLGEGDSKTEPKAPGGRRAGGRGPERPGRRAGPRRRGEHDAAPRADFRGRRVPSARQAGRGLGGARASPRHGGRPARKGRDAGPAAAAAQVPRRRRGRGGALGARTAHARPARSPPSPPRHPRVPPPRPRRPPPPAVASRLPAPRPAPPHPRCGLPLPRPRGGAPGGGPPAGPGPGLRAARPGAESADGVGGGRLTGNMEKGRRDPRGALRGTRWPLTRGWRWSPAGRPPSAAPGRKLPSGAPGGLGRPPVLGPDDWGGHVAFK